MSYLYMKVLELIPEEYDRGIKRITRTDWDALRGRIVDSLPAGARVLDLGCGPGTFALLAAARGCRAVGWDRNANMVTFARGKAVELGLAGRASFEVADAPTAAVPAEPFDAVVISLALSEMRWVEQLATLELAWRALRPDGRLVVLDEVPPRRFLARAWYEFKRFFLKAAVYVVARAITRPLYDLPAAAARAGFAVEREDYLEGGALLHLEATRTAGRAEAASVPMTSARSLGDLLADALAYLLLNLTFLRTKPGLYELGGPGAGAPVFVTANFTLTFNQLRRALRGLACYILVLDTRGINVWCAAGGDKFSTREVAVAARAFRLADVPHRTPLVLPKLAATGVSVHELKASHGLAATFGPVYARDIPAYIVDGYKKSDTMQRADFGLQKRLAVTWSFALGNAALVALPLVIFHHLYSPLAIAAAAAVSFLIGALFPWLPSRLYSVKGLAAAALVAVPLVPHIIAGGGGGRSVALWALFLAFAGVLLGLEFSGDTATSSPSRVRQEFRPGLAVLAALALAFALVRLL